MMTKEAIDNLGAWYCPACTIRIKEEEEPQALEEDPKDDEDPADEDDLEKIEQELIACAEEAKQI